MYSPGSFRVSDDAVVLPFIECYDFATLITSTAKDGVLITHVPLFLKRSKDRAVLQGHVAKANPHWRRFDGGTPSIAIFHGPHAYVSPAWYQNKPAVPTWNYAVVHAHGRPRITEDRQVTLDILQNLVRKNERHRSEPWEMAELSPEYYEQMASRIIAFEMPIDSIEAKFKLGQNRSEEDREGTISGLLGADSLDAAALATFMREQSGINGSD